MLLLVVATLLAEAAPAPAVDPSHRALTDCPREPGCSALVLLDEVELDNAPDHPRRSIHRLIKVFTQEGIDEHSDVELTEATTDVDIMNLTGRTILPDGSTIPLLGEHVQLKTGMVAGGRLVRRRSANFPGVIPGAILEISYDEVRRNAGTISEIEWRIQRSIPVLKARMTLRQGPLRMQWSQVGLEALPVAHASPSGYVDEFTAVDVPSLPFEPLAPPPGALQARLVFFSPVTAGDWMGQLAGRLAGETGRFIQSSSGVAQRVTQILAPTDPPLEKVRKIYHFVQETIGGEEHRLGEAASEKVKEAESVDDVLTRGYGDGRERTLLFVSMAKEAGLEPALLSIVPRSAGRLDQKTPDEAQLDSLAAAVKIGEGWTFYDLSVKLCPFAMVSAEKESDVPNAILFKPEKGQGFKKQVHVSGRVGTVYDSVPYFVVTIPASRAERNVLTREALVTLAGPGGGSVQVTERGTGLADMDLRQDLLALDEAGRRTYMERRAREIHPGATLVASSVEDLDAYQKPVTIRYTVSLPEEGELAADRLIVPVSILGRGERNPFTAATRRAPVSFQHTLTTHDRILIEAPAGFQPEDLPDRVLVEEGPLKLATFFSRELSRIVFTRHLQTDTISWPAADYARLRDFFEKVREADEQVLVFKRTIDP